METVRNTGLIHPPKVELLSEGDSNCIYRDAELLPIQINQNLCFEKEMNIFGQRLQYIDFYNLVYLGVYDKKHRKDHKDGVRVNNRWSCDLEPILDMSIREFPD